MVGVRPASNMAAWGRRQSLNWKQLPVEPDAERSQADGPPVRPECWRPGPAPPGTGPFSVMTMTTAAVHRTQPRRFSPARAPPTREKLRGPARDVLPRQRSNRYEIGMFIYPALAALHGNLRHWQRPQLFFRLHRHEEALGSPPSASWRITLCAFILEPFYTARG